MTNSDSDAKYIVYKHYDDVKYQFDRSKDFVYDNNEFEKIINDVRAEAKRLKLSDDIFIRLHKTLLNYGVFYKTHLIDNYCIFVNLWLNDQNTCLGYVKYLNDDIYNRMEILISLYKTYNQIKTFSGTDNDYLCSLFSFMGRNYRDAIDNHKSDSNFIKILEEFINSIKTDKWSTNDICPLSNYIKFPEQNPPQSIKTSEELKQPKDLPHVPASHDLPRLQNSPSSDSRLSSHDTPGSQGPSRTEDNAQRDQLLGSHFTARSRENSDPVVENTSQYSSEQRGERGLQINSLYAASLEVPIPARQVQNMETDESWSTEGFGRYKTMDTSEGSITVLDPNTHAIPQVGLMRIIQVGAFFRGGRGRVRRIPSGFHGPFLGEFPGYEEYDGRYIGYGPMNPLAE
ncbi:variable surface protein Vir6, putative [Plasmodium vivax]|uniref:Variable surface protein Vir6, putative n=1 Tax=Plasmodium vivax (strain Salvador I) TaxID=126793 RepID=A5KD81_PLAVS|nr:variable surface protein Vir6, putative [Plasmodium vivax]EDL42688.1 variable surface protein Vir6, putative [Plasmodium vivax]|eukprot:XP_001612481.1 variable surface protein Vir6 [Plasmodium vivax Sal-1]